MLSGDVYICSTILVEQASPPHLLKAADTPISKPRKPAVGGSLDHSRSQAVPEPVLSSTSATPAAVLHPRAAASSTDTDPIQDCPYDRQAIMLWWVDLCDLASTRIDEKCIQGKVLWTLDYRQNSTDLLCSRQSWAERQETTVLRNQIFYSAVPRFLWC